MPTTPRTVTTVLAGVLLLAACGTQRPSEGARAGGAGGPVSADPLCPSEFTQYGSAPETGEPTAAARPSGKPTPLLLPSIDGPGEDGVKVTALYAWAPGTGCGGAENTAEFEVTNTTTESATFTVTLGFLSSSGGAVDNVERTVESVGPGKTVREVVALGEMPGQAPDVTGVDVVKVRSVPADEAPSASGTCPPSGIHVYADEGDAAMGLRVVGLHLVNCGKQPYRVNGYPELELLDEDHDTVDGVRILQGTEQISTATGGDGSPQPVVLQPGEAAQAVLAWRNTTQAGDPVNAPYVRVRAKPGARPVTVMPELDLGTTGKLGVGPWKKDETFRGTDGAAPQ